MIAMHSIFSSLSLVQGNIARLIIVSIFVPVCFNNTLMNGCEIENPTFVWVWIRYHIFMINNFFLLGSLYHHQVFMRWHSKKTAIYSHKYWKRQYKVYNKWLEISYRVTIAEWWRLTSNSNHSLTGNKPGTVSRSKCRFSLPIFQIIIQYL